ncbi:MAG: deoxyribonuclease IV [Chloroflexi bacterium]|nr:deoxyribonuclease IV [Chloroflexota bacterium]
MKLGAHVSTAGGVHNAVDRAQEIGAEAIQIFASSPRAWAFKPPKEEHLVAFHEKSREVGLGPIFLHGSYLVNVGGTPELVEKSVQSLTQHMNAAGELGAKGVIFHSGSHKGVGFDAVLDQAAAALNEVLSNSPEDVQLIIENCAGMGAQIGASFQELGRMIKAVDSDRIKICLDTEHAFAAGYNIADPDAIDAAMKEFDDEIGLDRLVVVHANDAKVELGSGVDRHENIGEGHIGLDGFQTIMGHSAFRDVPFLLEVPGVDKKGPDKVNLDRLKEIRTRLDVPIC